MKLKTLLYHIVLCIGAVTFPIGFVFDNTTFSRIGVGCLLVAIIVKIDLLTERSGGK